jgi:hypothetical protein
MHFSIWISKQVAGFANLLIDTCVQNKHYDFML